MRIAAFWRCNLLTQRRAVAQHRSDTELGILLRVNGGGMDEQNRAGVFVDDIADAVIQKLGLANLRCSNHNDVPYFGIGESVHRLSQIRGALCTPRSGFGCAFCGQAALRFRPLTHCEIIWRRHTCQRFPHGFIQPCRSAPFGLPFSFSFSQFIGRCVILRHSCAPHCSSRAARLPFRRISPGRSDTQPARA